jgi:hypothetical protein
MPRITMTTSTSISVNPLRAGPCFQVDLIVEL